MVTVLSTFCLVYLFQAVFLLLCNAISSFPVLVAATISGLTCLCKLGRAKQLP